MYILFPLCYVRIFLSDADKKYGGIRISYLSDRNMFLEICVFPVDSAKGSIHAIFGFPNYQNDNFTGQLVG